MTEDQSFIERQLWFSKPIKMKGKLFPMSKWQAKNPYLPYLGRNVPYLKKINMPKDRSECP